MFWHPRALTILIALKETSRQSVGFRLEGIWHFHYGVSLRVLKKTPSEGYLGPCQKPMMKEVFLAEVVNVFQQFTFSQKSTPIAVRHNPKQDIILNRYFSYDFYCSTSWLFEADLSNFYNSYFSERLWGSLFNWSLYGNLLLSLLLSEI